MPEVKEVKVKKKTKSEIKRDEEMALQLEYLQMWDRNIYTAITTTAQLKEVLATFGNEVAADTETKL